MELNDERKESKSMATKKSNAVAKASSQAVADWGDYAGNSTGFEGADRSELAIPFINLLQSNSEVVEDGNAKAGQLYNNVMETIHDELTIVPCARQRVFVEWVPVEDGGGLVAVHEPDSDFVKTALKAHDNNPRDMKVDGEKGQHDLVETIYLYCLVVDEDGGLERAVISFASSKLKKYRQFFTRASSQMMSVNGRKFNLPLWAHRWVLSSEQEVSKANGKKFQNFTLRWDGETAKEARLTPKDEMFVAGQEFHDLVIGGEAKADLSTADGNETTEKSGDIPF
jgi:hypothetical protein